MKTNEFDKHIRNLIHNESSPLDVDQFWNTLEPKLPQKKKRSILFYWTFFAIGIGVFLFWHLKLQQNHSYDKDLISVHDGFSNTNAHQVFDKPCTSQKSQAISDAPYLGTKSTEVMNKYLNKHDKDYLDQQSNSKNKQLNSSNQYKSIENETLNIDHSITDYSSVQHKHNLQSRFLSPSETRKPAKMLSIQDSPKEYRSSNHLYDNPKQDSKNNNHSYHVAVNSENTDPNDNNNSSKQERNNEPVFFGINPSDQIKSSNINENPDTQILQNHTHESSNSNLANAVNLDSMGTHKSNTNEQSQLPSTVSKQKIWQFAVAFNAGLGIYSKNLSKLILADTISNYANIINNITKKQESRSVDLNFVVGKNNWNLVTGININQYVEKLNFTQQQLLYRYQLGQIALKLKEDSTIYDTGEGWRSFTTRSIRYNKYTQININSGIQYRLPVKHIDFLLGAGIYWNVKLSAKGILPDQQLVLTNINKTDAFIWKKRVNPAYYLNIQPYYNLNQHWTISPALEFQYNADSYIKSDNFKLNFQNLGFKLGLLYVF